jgi:hypothetical protein
MICGVFSVLSDLNFEDILNDIVTQAQNLNIRNNVVVQLYICHILLFFIAVFMVYFGEGDNPPTQDFENFKNLMEQHGLE